MHAHILAFPGVAVIKDLPVKYSICKRHGFDPWVGKIPWSREMATHSSILAWKIPWTEEPGGLQTLGSQRVRHN